MTHHFKKEINAIKMMVPKWTEDYPSFRWNEWDHILNRTIQNTTSVFKNGNETINYIFDDILYGFIRIQEVIGDPRIQTYYLEMLGRRFSKHTERDNFTDAGKLLSTNHEEGYYTSLRDDGFLYFCKKYGLKNL